MRVLIATDAWHPQVNGVVRTLTSLARSARNSASPSNFCRPKAFRPIPVPTYPGLRLALPSRRRIARRIEQARPDAIHIATEGPIGHMVRAYCRRHGRPFTTSYTTRFPEYISAACADPGKLDLRRLAPLSCRRGRDHGGDAVADRRAERARICQSRHVDARRRHRSVQPGSRHRARFSAADFHQCRTGRGRKESRGISFARSARHQGRHRRGPAGGGAAAPVPRRKIPRPPGERKAWPPIWPPPMSSYFQAGPTRSAWCSLKRSRAAFRSLLFRSPVRRMWSADNPIGALNEDLRAACLDALANVPRGVPRIRAEHSWENSARQFIGHIAESRRRQPIAGRAWDWPSRQPRTANAAAVASILKRKGSSHDRYRTLSSTRT